MEPRDFLKFDKMLTPIIIQVLFWIGLVLSVLFGLGMIVAGFFSDAGGVGVLLGLFYLLLGPLLTRIYCEILIIIFKIHENLTDVKSLLSNRHVVPSVPPPDVT